MPDPDDILLLNNSGIITVELTGRFNPNVKIERQQAAVMLAKTARVLGIDIVNINDIELKYNDSDKISESAIDYIKFVTYLKIMRGDDKNNFYPGRYITYQELYSAFLNLCNLKEAYDKKII